MNRPLVPIVLFVLLEVLLVPTVSRSAALTSDATFLDALVEPAGPSTDLGPAAADVGWLAGSWDAEVIDYPRDGPPRRGRGEWHFAWVLEGRALQDVWIVPPRAERGRTPAESADGPGNRYGSTLRVFDAEDGLWRITWINPVTGVESRLAGRRAGGDLVLEGLDDEGVRMRWSFTEIEPAIDSGAPPRSFRWLGESSRDDGETWRLDAEFQLTRWREATEPAARPAAAAPLTRRWRLTDMPGLESVEIHRTEEEVIADGAVLVLLDGVPTEVRYRLSYDAGWRFLRGTIRSRAGSGDEQAMEIVHDPTASPAAAWRIDGEPRADLAGCVDIDLMVTPFTNTPPLRSSPLAPGEARATRVAWIRWPEFRPQAVDQEYLRLDDPEPAEAPAAEARYRYRNLDSGFVGELTVDDETLVLDYGPWRRLR